MSNTLFSFLLLRLFVGLQYFEEHGKSETELIWVSSHCTFIANVQLLQTSQIIQYRLPSSAIWLQLLLVHITVMPKIIHIPKRIIQIANKNYSLLTQPMHHNDHFGNS